MKVKVLLFIIFLSLMMPVNAQQKVKFNFDNTDKSIAHFNIGVYFARNAQFQKAIDEFLTASALNPANPDIFYNLGVAYGALEQYDEAIRWYKKVLEVKPDDSNSYFNIAVTLSQLNRDSEAEQYYLKSIEFKKDMVPAHANLAIYYLNKGNRTKYTEHLAILEKIDPQTAQKVKKAAEPVQVIRKK